jgi:hypothetical protein
MPWCPSLRNTGWSSEEASMAPAMLSAQPRARCQVAASVGRTASTAAMNRRRASGAKTSHAVGEVGGGVTAGEVAEVDDGREPARAGQDEVPGMEVAVQPQRGPRSMLGTAHAAAHTSPQPFRRPGSQDRRELGKAFLHCGVPSREGSAAPDGADRRFRRGRRAEGGEERGERFRLPGPVRRGTSLPHCARGATRRCSSARGRGRTAILYATAPMCRRQPPAPARRQGRGASAVH